MSEDRFQLLRLVEAILFASREPLAEKTLASRLPEAADLPGLLDARSAISTLGAKAMAAMAPPEDAGGAEDGESEESGPVRDFDSVVAAAEAAMADEDDDPAGT